MPASEVNVAAMRRLSSRREMIPSRSAATALHMYAPMSVGDVCTLVLPSPFRTSAGRPDGVSTIAASDAHVRARAAVSHATVARALRLARLRTTPRIERRVTALLRRMTLQEKLEQLTLLSDGQINDAEAMKPVGGVFSLVDPVKINQFQH